LGWPGLKVPSSRRRHQSSTVATIGLDIENTFHLVGPDKRGTIVLRSKRCPYFAISHIQVNGASAYGGHDRQYLLTRHGD